MAECHLKGRGISSATSELVKEPFERGVKNTNMLGRLKKFSVTCALGYVGIVVLMMFLETMLMYPAPNKQDGDWNPSWLKYEEVSVLAEDGIKVHGWFCEHPDARGALMLCHGNGEHLAFMAEELAYLRERFSMSVLAFDYRGYGKSEGTPFESGILLDGEAMQAWLADRTGQKPGEVFLYGRSLGGAVAVHLGAKNGARGLILDRTFSSMVDVAADHYPWLPVRMVLRNRYASAKWIQQFEGPLLQFHGMPDQIVPFRFGKRLFDSCPSQDKHFVESMDLGHNDPWPEEFYDELTEFFERNAGPREAPR